MSTPLSVETAAQALIDFDADARAALADARAGFDGLAADLRATVKRELAFTALIDETHAGAPGGDPRVYRTIAEAIADAPAASLIVLRIKAGQTAQVADVCYLNDHTLRIHPEDLDHGTAAVRFTTGVSDGLNRLAKLHAIGSCAVFFVRCTVYLDGKADPALGWDATRTAAIGARRGNVPTPLGLEACQVYGADGNGLCSPADGGMTVVTLSSVDVSGQCGLVIDAAGGLSIVSEHNVTLVNNAAVTLGGGTELLGNVVRGVGA